MRARRSVAPPAGNPTMMRAVFFNACARDGCGSSPMRAEAARTARRVGMVALSAVARTPKREGAASLDTISRARYGAAPARGVLRVAMDIVEYGAETKKARRPSGRREMQSLKKGVALKRRITAF